MKMFAFTSVGATEEKESKGRKIGDLAKASQQRREKDVARKGETKAVRPKIYPEATCRRHGPQPKAGKWWACWKKSVAESHRGTSVQRPLLSPVSAMTVIGPQIAVAGPS